MTDATKSLSGGAGRQRRIEVSHLGGCLETGCRVGEGWEGCLEGKENLAERTGLHVTQGSQDWGRHAVRIELRSVPAIVEAGCRVLKLAQLSAPVECPVTDTRVQTIVAARVAAGHVGYPGLTRGWCRC